MKPQQRLLRVIYAFAAIIVVGAGGYMAIEGWSLLDALYMTVITITTVGYAEVHPLSTGGQIFSIFLIVGGVGGALYALNEIIGYIVEGSIRATWGRRHMKTRIAKMTNHFILCGYGDVGREIGRVFSQEGVPFVVIDKDQDSIANAEKDGNIYLLADATNDEVLKEAGIERARGLMVAVGDDAESTYITLSSHMLRPDLFIEARASSNEAEVKLKRAGADRIIDPHSIGAQRMALLALRPAVVDFIDTIIYRRGREFQMENIVVVNDSPLVGLTVGETRQCSSANVLAISKKSGKLLANPSGEETIEAGDRLIIMGTREQLASLEGICEGVKSNE